MKRAFDMIAASVGMLLLFVPMLIIAVLVRFNLGKPVWFMQERSGHAARRTAV
jgi:lipopolysaccharide/colanic/teichoic acid biosynthesis glycosyltransferase